MYVNPAGGRSLYDAADFECQGLSLRFCSMRDVRYAQRAATFVPNLSIIDVLMHCAPRRVAALLDECDLLP